VAVLEQERDGEWDIGNRRTTKAAERSQEGRLDFGDIGKKASIEELEVKDGFHVRI
jgi:hypothetical protein